MALVALWPATGECLPTGYEFSITTAYANANPFGNRIDTAYTEPSTGYIQIVNTGQTTFAGILGTIALSVNAGNMSFTSAPLVLAPGADVSIAVANNSAVVAGFNGPAYFYRPGVEIYLTGIVSTAWGESETIDLLVADRDIHSGVWRTDRFGLDTDSFVLQGGDPWGFDSGYDFAISQAEGVYVFAQAAPEPASAACLAAGLTLLSATRRRFKARPA
jgi:hypothetical protein